MPFDEFFDWRDKRISNWKKVLRIAFRHEFKDVHVRGYTAQESALMILNLHKKDLDKDEIEFLQGLQK